MMNKQKVPFDKQDMIDQVIFQRDEKMRCILYHANKIAHLYNDVIEKDEQIRRLRR